MQSDMLPKILSISISTWHIDSGIHTETDLFKFWSPERLAQIYTRSDLPNTPVCSRFFRISENKIIKSVYKRTPVGERVENSTEIATQDKKAVEEERKLYEKAHKKKSWFMTLVRELVWALGKWKTKALDSFIEEEQPDVYFVPIYPVVFMGKLQLHILKKHPRPYVCYLADDNYSYKNCGNNILAYIHRFFLRKVVKKLAKNCNQMFTITQTGADEVDKTFGTQSIVLTKGIDYSSLTYRSKPISRPVKMVYTGKLLIGRAQSLVAISKAMKNINKDGQRVTLDIYSPDVLDKKTMNILNENGCCFRGSVTKEEVERVQNEADVVVFVESLEKKYRYTARLSFSTKLTDYFRSGKCIFAIGDESIAPIQYLQDNDCAICATSYKQIEEKLREMLDDKEKISSLGRKAFDCGKKNHDEVRIRKIFRETFIQAVEKSSKV